MFDDILAHFEPSSVKTHLPLASTTAQGQVGFVVFQNVEVKSMPSRNNKSNKYRSGGASKLRTAQAYERFLAAVDGEGDLSYDDWLLVWPTLREVGGYPADFAAKAYQVFKGTMSGIASGQIKLVAPDGSVIVGGGK
jgi:hypothetical protein